MAHLRNYVRLFSLSGELGRRHRPSPAAAPFPATLASIEAYLEETRRRVEQARTDLDGADREAIVAGNSACRLWQEGRTGLRRGVLLVHGLADSPFLMRDLAEAFHQRGFDVLVMQLPGHGTRPGDLLQTRYQDWVQAVRQVRALMEREVDELYLGGFSTGALLSLLEAQSRPGIRALLLFSPALRITAMARMTCPLARMGRWSPRFAWFDVQPDSDCYRYESLTNRAICEVDRLIRTWRRGPGREVLRVPLFVAAAAADVTVDSEATLHWFARQSCAPRRMIYYSAAAGSLPQGVKWMPSRLPQQRIHDFAHTATALAPSNPHYGAEGDYRACIHYYRLDPARYRRCKAGEEDCLGEMFRETPECRIVRRLTYNPHFDAMLADIDDFLDEVKAAGEGRLVKP
ncbi:MAG TPA: alpha/beta fold hydrolase [Gammaproteobacteria bacterium]|nr:alpha/beta fold hydrolase [Gammaproteobacteria bacterium]